MKKLNFILIALLSVLLAVGCEKEQPIIPIIKSSDIVLTPQAQDVEIPYTIENAMEGMKLGVAVDADWISDLDFSTEGLITFKVALNESEARKTEMVLSYPDAADVTVMVTQQAAGYSISVSRKSLSFVSRGGELELNVISDRPWTLSGGADWIKPSATQGNSGDIVKFTCAPSQDLDPRETVFVFKCGAEEGVEVKVTQNQLGRIIIEKAVYNVPFEANNLTVTLQANTEVGMYVSSPNSSWVHLPQTKGLETKNFVIRIDANPVMEQRSATVVFENSDASEQIEIIQAEMYPYDVADMFGDLNFRNYIRSTFDADGDGKISREEAEGVTEIDAQFKEIAEISGLEMLINLKKLNLNGNMLKDVDLTQNPLLEVVNVNSNPKIGSLNISGLEHLTELRAGWSQMETLNIEGSDQLREMTLIDVRLSELDITSLKSLQQLAVSGATFTSIDLSQNTELFYLSIENYELESIDLSANKKLTSLSLMLDRSVTEFGVTELEKLGEVIIKSTGMTEFSLPKAKKLWSLELNDNQSLKTLDVSKNYYLQRLDMSSCFDLEKVIMFNGQEISDMYGVDPSIITYVDFEYPEDCAESIEDAVLKQFILDNYDTDKNGMISKAEADMVTVLNCPAMGIQTITGIQFFEKITEIDCSGNEITDLKLPSQKLLVKLNASGNKLTSIDLSNTSDMQELYLQNNSLTYIGGIFDMRSIKKADLSNNALEGEFSFKNKRQMTEFNISNNKLTSISVHNCSGLLKFDCSNNQISSFTLWTLKKMEEFNCSNNPVTGLPLEKVVALKVLNCSKTNVTTLNLSNNTAMQQLICTECPDLAKIYVGDVVIPDIQKDETAEVINGLPE